MLPAGAVFDPRRMLTGAIPACRRRARRAAGGSTCGGSDAWTQLRRTVAGSGPRGVDTACTGDNWCRRRCGGRCVLGRRLGRTRIAGRSDGGPGRECDSANNRCRDDRDSQDHADLRHDPCYRHGHPASPFGTGYLRWYNRATPRHTDRLRRDVPEEASLVSNRTDAHSCPNNGSQWGAKEQLKTAVLPDNAARPGRHGVTRRGHPCLVPTPATSLTSSADRSRPARCGRPPPADGLVVVRSPHLEAMGQFRGVGVDELYAALPCWRRERPRRVVAEW
jgi:hypothetical protein